MTARHDLDRMLDAFLSDGPVELPDPSFDSVRDRMETTRQRVVIGPWRVPDMNKFLALGAGIAAVVVVLAVGSRLLPAPADPTAGTGSSPAPAAASATIAPTTAPSPTPSPAPSTSPSPVPATPPLTQSFTSQMHGFSMSYPEGWIARAATEPWTDRPGEPEFVHPGFDVLRDPVLGDHLFLRITSKPIGDSTPDEWVAEQVAGEGCTATEPIAVGGATGLIGTDDCDAVAVTTAGRGYVIWLHDSNDDPIAVAAYDRAWFEQVLATVQLHPEDAVNVAPPATQ